MPSQVFASSLLDALQTFPHTRNGFRAEIPQYRLLVFFVSAVFVLTVVVVARALNVFGACLSTTQSPPAASDATKT